MAVTTDAATTRALIINADDFGMSPGINRGIMEAVDAGIVTSASLMVGMPAFDDAVRSARMTEGALGVGVHLTLTVGRPLTRAESLVDSVTGEFFPAAVQFGRGLVGQIRPADVVDECKAQIERARVAGVTVTHLDGHLHVHLWPGIAHAVRHVLETEGVAATRRPNEPLFRGPLWRRRLPERAIIGWLASRTRLQHWPVATTDHFVGSTLLGMSDFESGLLAVLDLLPVGTTELMVHPGYDDGPLPGYDQYRSQREVELRALTSPAVRERLQCKGVRLINFGALPALA